MASTDIENKSENLTTTVDQETSTKTSMPIYDASSSHQHSHSCNDPSHHHHYPMFFDDEHEHSSAAAKAEMLMKKKAKKNQKQDVTRAELIPGHQGDKNIDDLVNFINGPSPANNAGKKSKKKSTTNN